MIPQEKIDQILDNVNIVEVLNEYIPLKRSGQNFKACCPFHNEKTPSFVVSPQKQIFHCFGCGEGGNTLGFLMKYENLTFPEAIEMLAKRAGVELPRRSAPGKTSLSDKLYEINAAAAQFYGKQLAGPNGAKARGYLKERGINDQTVKDFILGYAPEGWENLKNVLLRKKIPAKLLRQAGLTLESKKGTSDYDRFRNRIIFPIANERGKIVAFGARVLDDTVPKYLNSPETDIYSKGRMLYGLNLSKAAIRQKGYAVIAEGYMDVIIPYQKGVRNVVATSGTALTSDQGRCLKRYTDTAVMVFDSDQAGQMASLRGVDVLLEADLRVKIAELPQGEDPASYVQQHGGEAFEKILKQAKDLFNYKLEVLLERFTMENKAAIVEEMLPTIALVNNAVTKADYLRRLAQRLDIHESSLRAEMKKVQKGRKYRFVTEQPKPTDRQTCRVSELHILGLSMSSKRCLETVKNGLGFARITNEKVRELLKAIEAIYEIDTAAINPAKLLSRYEADPFAKKLVMSAIEKAEMAKDPERAVDDCIRHILKEERTRDLKELTMKLRDAQRIQDQDLVNKLLHKINDLHKEKVG